MTAVAQTVGASVVGRLTDIAPWEAELILSMRFWMDGPEGQAAVWNGFARTLGATEGRVALRGFERLLSDLCTFARRPLVRHGPGCTCIGSDEALLQTLVREAARGDGSSGCAVLAIATVHGRCRIRSTERPGPALPVERSVPSASTVTPWKNDSDGATSVGVRPCFAAASVNSSRPAGLPECTSPAPYLAVLPARVEVPHRASW